MKLWKYIRQKLLEHPGQTVCEGDASMTYEQLCIYAESFAQRLTAPHYGILCGSELAAAMALLACFAAEKPAVPLPARYGKDYYMKIWERADSPCLITDIGGELRTVPMPPSASAESPASCPGGVGCSGQEAGSEADCPGGAGCSGASGGSGPAFGTLAAGSRSADGQEETGEEETKPAVILFTSGSTGTPKGVMLSGESLIANVEDIASYFQIGEQDRILISRPLYHSSVLTGELLVSLCQGAGIEFFSESFQPLRLLQLMRDRGITAFGSTPTLLSTLARFVRPGQLLPVRLLSVSGECMTEGMARAIRTAFPQTEVYCGYGLSEASPRVAYLPPALFDRQPTAAGIPLPHVRLCIVDEQGRRVCGWEVGELLVQGPNVMLGYFQDEERSRRVLHGGWLRTGDLACWGADGMLFIKGRKDDMVIRAGMNIYPAEIENALSADPRVQGVLVYGYPKNGTQEIGMKISGAFGSLQEVVALCRERLPDFQIPSKIELTEATEVLLGGKKKRRTV